MITAYSIFDGYLHPYTTKQEETKGKAKGKGKTKFTVLEVKSNTFSKGKPIEVTQDDLNTYYEMLDYPDQTELFFILQMQPNFYALAEYKKAKKNGFSFNKDEYINVLTEGIPFEDYFAKKNASK